MTTSKILIVRHAADVVFDPQKMETNPLSVKGIEEAFELKERIKGIFPNEDIETLSIRAFVSPAFRAIQTIAIAKTSGTNVKMTSSIGQSYFGWREMVTTINEYKDYFPLILVVTHQPVVALLTCELVQGDINDAMFETGTIKHCTGYLISDGKLERF